MGPRENALSGECWTIAPLPHRMSHLAEREKQFEFLREESVIVSRIETEQRIGLAEGTPANDNFGTAFRNQVEGSELLKHPHRVGGTQHRNRAREPDRLGAGSRSRQDDCRSRVQKFGTVVFAHAEDVEPNPISNLDLFKEIGHAIGSRRWLARPRIGEDCCKTIDADLHNGPLAESLAAKAWLFGSNLRCWRSQDTKTYMSPIPPA